MASGLVHLDLHSNKVNRPGDQSIRQSDQELIIKWMPRCKIKDSYTYIQLKCRMHDYLLLLAGDNSLVM